MANGRKTGGRQAGIPNKATAATRERIEREADPIGFLCRVANGEEIEAAPERESGALAKVRPTLDQRLSAAQTLARKIQPDATSYLEDCLSPVLIEIRRTSIGARKLSKP